MKKLFTVVAVVALMIVSTLVIARSASAEDAKMVGTISRIEIAADQKSATVTLKDSKSGENVLLVVTDEQTTDKFKDKHIVEGDEIRCKYEKEGGRNISRLFKKTAGC